ncbi:hypothetical protein KY289_001610 [Solanum tuberosum]|nr:hypothetical protein KY289_001610 [Solanum tuberosum]
MLMAPYSNNEVEGKTVGTHEEPMDLGEVPISMNNMEMDTDIEGIILTEEEKQRIYKAWTYSVIIKVMGKKIKENLQKALQKGPWFINGYFVSVKRSKLGKLEKIDVCTSAALRGRYARICVEVPIGVPVKKHISIDHHRQLLARGRGHTSRATAKDYGRARQNKEEHATGKDDDRQIVTFAKKQKHRARQTDGNEAKTEKTSESQANTTFPIRQDPTSTEPHEPSSPSSTPDSSNPIRGAHLQYHSCSGTKSDSSLVDGDESAGTSSLLQCGSRGQANSNPSTKPNLSRSSSLGRNEIGYGNLQQSLMVVHGDSDTSELSLSSDPILSSPNLGDAALYPAQPNNKCGTSIVPKLPVSIPNPRCTDEPSESAGDNVKCLHKYRGEPSTNSAHLQL